MSAQTKASKVLLTRSSRDLTSLVVVSLMLATPAWAGPSATDDPTGRQVAAKPVAAKPSNKPVASTHEKTLASHPKPAAKQASKATTKPGPVAKTVTAKPAPAVKQGAQALPVRRVAIANGGKFDRALLDDGTFWHERGSVTTWQQTGMASWYGGARWQGHRTSSGERYDQNQLTAAHATLPIGTKVRVVRTDGRGAVIVTINDRPGTRTRVIDLSRAAAKELGILNSGVAMVTLQPL